MLDARLLRSSACLDFSSLTRLWRIWAYSFCRHMLSAKHFFDSRCGNTHGSILGLLSLATLECDAMTLVLETLRSDETLDARSLGVCLGGLLALLLLGLNLAANDELADLL